jgi:hypothetical protein
MHLCRSVVTPYALWTVRPLKVNFQSKVEVLRRTPESTMDQYLMEGHYYQFVGRIREWIGTIADNELEVSLGRCDRLVGRTTEHRCIPLEETELRASEVTSN